MPCIDGCHDIIGISMVRLRGSVEECKGLNGGAGGANVKILYDPDDMKDLVIAAWIDQSFSQRVFPACCAYGGFIDDDCIRVGERLRKIPAFEDLQMHGGYKVFVRHEGSKGKVFCQRFG